jgi:hypothetical protein
MSDLKKAYLIRHNIYYLDLYDFHNEYDFSNRMYEIVNAHVKEDFDTTAPNEV